ncbi:hypothetical protein QFC22_000475 [Naganishia vaughanmartiniae]|uniref:Uncharacterized protein n=1 Tax=Naganishia vaughanmartiniae TaxID=1424756 RepID=A0ACC2XN69_9TREE|nr:hypothetical protein QFC22_000475 [Naganishia vaughanmartiniae]
MAAQMRALRIGSSISRSLQVQRIALYQIQPRIQIASTTSNTILLNGQRQASTYVRHDRRNADNSSQSSGNRYSSDRKPHEQRSRVDSGNARQTYNQGFSKRSSGGDPEQPRNTWRKRPEDGTRRHDGKEQSYGKTRYSNQETSDLADKGQRRNDRSSASVRRPRSDDSREPRTYASDRYVDADVPVESGKFTETTLDKRLRIYPGTSPYDASVHLNNFIRNERNPKGHVKAKADNANYLDMAEEIVKTGPRESVNIAVWNVLLSGFGKERKYQRMFKLFNDMKKRGIRPSARTYAIMLSNYPSSLDAPDKTISRATLLYDEAQRHIQQVLDQIAEAKESEGYELSSDRPRSRNASGSSRLDNDVEDAAETDELKLDAYTSGNAAAPTNAYLALLCHFVKFDEMKRVYDAMPKDGPMAPDGRTYTILFEGNIAFARTKKEKGKVAKSSESAQTNARTQETATEDEQMLFDSQEIWKEIISRQEEIAKKAAKQTKQNQRSGPRLMDEQDSSSLIDDRLVVTALRSFMAGTPEDQTYALNEIVPTVYNLSAPGRASSASGKTTMSNLAVHIELTERAAETILKLCLATNRTQEGVHYAHQLLNMPKAFVSQLGLTHYNAILALYSKINDVGQCLELLDTKPGFLQGQDWPRSSWIFALKAAKFAGDWDSFQIAFTRMTRTATGIAQGKAVAASTEKGISVDDQMASLLLSTAASTSRISAIREAMRIFAHYYVARPEEAGNSDTDASYWRRQLLDSAEKCMSQLDAAGKDAESGRDAAEESGWKDLVASLKLAHIENTERAQPTQPRRYETPRYTNSPRDETLWHTKSTTHDETPRYNKSGRDEKSRYEHPRYSRASRDETPRFNKSDKDETSRYNRSSQDETSQFTKRNRDETPVYNKSSRDESAPRDERPRSSFSVRSGERRDSRPRRGFGL